MAIDKLTEKEKKFCSEYIYDWNATRSYKVAYPNTTTDNSAAVSANKMLRKPKIQAYIESIQKDIEKQCGISRNMVMREHMRLAFSSIAHLHNTWIERKEFDELTDDEKACIAEISTQIRNITINDEPIEVEFVRIKLYDKQKSLDSISKMLGYNEPEKHEINVASDDYKRALEKAKKTNGDDSN